MKEIQIKAIRKDDGQMLFVEADADFVNVLTNIQHLPVGVLARIAGKNNTCSRFQNTCSNLRNHVFEIPKNKTLLLDNKVNLKELVGTDVKQPIVPTLKTHNMSCTGEGNGPYTCNGNGSSISYDRATAFCGLGSHFELTLKTNGAMMLGVLPDDSDLPSRLTTLNLYSSFGCFLETCSSARIYPQGGRLQACFDHHAPSNGRELKMRFQQEPQKLEYSYNGNSWYEINIVNGNYGNNEGAPYCPVLLSYKNCPFTVTNVKSSDDETLTLHKEEFFKAESTFLVTNDLMVSDSTSFSSHLQLLQKYEVSNVLTLKTDIIDFGHLELQRLISAIFNGDQNVLGFALDGYDTKNGTAMATTNGITRNHSTHENDESTDVEVDQTISTKTKTKTKTKTNKVVVEEEISSNNSTTDWTTAGEDGDY